MKISGVNYHNDSEEQEYKTTFNTNHEGPKKGKGGFTYVTSTGQPSTGGNTDGKEWRIPFKWDQEVDQANKMLFKFNSFRPQQKEIINATKSKKDVLALIPTGIQNALI